MKTIFLILNLFTLPLFARAVEIVPAYIVVKDEYDASIPEGYYILEGTVLNIGNNKRMSGVTIDPEGKDPFTCGKNGSFSIKMPVTSTQVEFYKEGFQYTYFENYEPKSRHRIRVLIHMSRAGSKKEIPAEKPVVYAYSETDMDLKIHLEAKGKLQFSYPILSENQDWELKLQNNRLTDRLGNSYPYLFWESLKENPAFIRTAEGQLPGIVLEKTQILPYLDSILTAVGLNANEKTDFITYWGPRLVGKEYAFLQFQTGEECDQFATYGITPQPEHFNRLYLLFCLYEDFPKELKPIPRKLKVFERTGFHLVEWGGLEMTGMFNL